MLGLMRTTSGMVLLMAVVALGLSARPAAAVVGGLTNTSEFLDPGSAYYGMNTDYVVHPYQGSSVAIGYYTLLSADHYGNNKPGDEFSYNGDTWRIASVETLAPSDTSGLSPDLRILRLENVTSPYKPLPGYYDLYGGDVGIGSTVVITGYGDDGETYDRYYTDTAGTGGVLRWGTNFTEGTELYRDSTNTHETKVMKLRFGAYGMSHPLTNTWTEHESGLGLSDSGGGFLINDNGEWKLAGIGLYREVYSGGYRDFFAADIATYQAELYQVLSTDLLYGDVNLDGNVDSVDLRTLATNMGMSGAGWLDGDFTGDGVVDAEDYLIFKMNFGYESSPHPIMTVPESAGGLASGGDIIPVPEPASALLMAMGASALVRRRKRQR